MTTFRWLVVPSRGVHATERHHVPRIGPLVRVGSRCLALGRRGGTLRQNGDLVGG